MKKDRKDRLKLTVYISADLARAVREAAARANPPITQAEFVRRALELAAGGLGAT